MNRAEQLEAHPPPPPGYIENYTDRLHPRHRAVQKTLLMKNFSRNDGLQTADQAEQLEAQPPPPQCYKRGGTPLLMPRPAEMNTKTGEYQTTRLAQSSVGINPIFAVESQEKLPGSERTRADRISSALDQHGED